MRKIVNGFRYDTDKAELVGSNGYSRPGDFDYFHESLYVTAKAKRFFLYGEGGARSRYSEHTSNNSWSGGQALIPLTKEEALRWCEENLDPVEFEHHFDGMIEEA